MTCGLTRGSFWVCDADASAATAIELGPADHLRSIGPVARLHCPSQLAPSQLMHKDDYVETSLLVYNDVTTPKP